MSGGQEVIATPTRVADAEARGGIRTRARRRAQTRGRRDRLNLGSLALALPDSALTVVLFLLPIVFLLLYSFWETNWLTLAIEHIWTWANYSAVFSSLYIDAFIRSLEITAVTVIGCLVIGFPVAYAISRAPGRLQMVLLVGIVIPFWTSFVVRTYALLTVLSPQGPLVKVASALGILASGTDLRYGTFAITVGMIYAYLPLTILPLYSTLQRLDPALFDAAADLGKNRTRTFFRVVVPQSGAGILAGCLLVGIPALGEYTIPTILGGGKTLLLGNVIATEFLGTGDYSGGAALSAVLMAIVMLLVIVSQLSRRRVVRP